jgi:hypothetical protein
MKFELPDLELKLKQIYSFRKCVDAHFKKELHLRGSVGVTSEVHQTIVIVEIAITLDARLAIDGLFDGLEVVH